MKWHHNANVLVFCITFRDNTLVIKRVFQQSRFQYFNLKASIYINIKFPIETGRWNGVSKHERICYLCGNGIGDEFHYLFIYEKQEIKTIREKFIPIYYMNYPTELKLSRMLIYCHLELYRNLASFLKIMVRFLQTVRFLSCMLFIYYFVLLYCIYDMSICIYIECEFVMSYCTPVCLRLYK